MTAALHDAAVAVDCPRKPKGCSAPAGQRCVNWAVTRDPDQHPPTTRIPHAARLAAARAEVPEQRALPPVPVWGDDGVPLPDEPAGDEEGW